MRINVNRLCKLAGIDSGSSSRRSLNEASNRSWHEDPSVSDEADFRYGKNQLSENDQRELEEFAEGLDDDIEEGLDDEIEVDEQMLVQELRRARKIMNESRKRKNMQRRRRSSRRQRQVNETKIKTIVEQEVDNVMREMNLTGGWIYGNKKPRRSRKGRVATAFPGIGFKN